MKDMKIARTVWLSFVVIGALFYALGSWFGWADTERWMIGILWLNMAFTACNWIVEMWVEV